MPTTLPGFSALTFNPVRFRLVANTQRAESPLTGSVQTTEFPGARWQADLTFTPANPRDDRRMRAFLASLRGSAGRFYLWDPSATAPLGIATGTPVVDGPGNAGATLYTRGWTPSTGGILLAGDLITVNNEMKIVTADAASNGAGQAALSIEPPLRATPVNGQIIVTRFAYAVMMLADDNQGEWGYHDGQLSPVSFQAREAF